jgi:soluble cytochrome b562
MKSENQKLKIENHEKTKELAKEVEDLKADQQDLQDKLSHALIENIESNKRFKDFQEKNKNCVIPVKREDKLV